MLLLKSGKVKNDFKNQHDRRKQYSEKPARPKSTSKTIIIDSKKLFKIIKSLVKRFDTIT